MYKNRKTRHFNNKGHQRHSHLENQDQAPKLLTEILSITKEGIVTIKLVIKIKEKSEIYLRKLFIGVSSGVYLKQLIAPKLYRHLFLNKPIGRFGNIISKKVRLNECKLVLIYSLYLPDYTRYLVPVRLVYSNSQVYGRGQAAAIREVTNTITLSELPTINTLINCIGVNHASETYNVDKCNTNSNSGSNSNADTIYTDANASENIDPKDSFQYEFGSVLFKQPIIYHPEDQNKTIKVKWNKESFSLEYSKLRTLRLVVLHLTNGKAIPIVPDYNQTNFGDFVNVVFKPNLSVNCTQTYYVNKVTICFARVACSMPPPPPPTPTTMTLSRLLINNLQNNYLSIKPTLTQLTKFTVPQVFQLPTKIDILFRVYLSAQNDTTGPISNSISNPSPSPSPSPSLFFLIENLDNGQEVGMTEYALEVNTYSYKASITLNTDQFKQEETLSLNVRCGENITLSLTVDDCCLY